MIRETSLFSDNEGRVGPLAGRFNIDSDYWVHCSIVKCSINGPTNYRVRLFESRRTGGKLETFARI